MNTTWRRVRCLVKRLRSPSNRLFRQNVQNVKRAWPSAQHESLRPSLRELTTTFSFSVALGDLSLLDGKWYVTHAGLLRLARRQGCRGIQTRPLREFCDPGASRWVFRAVVYLSRGSKGFVGYGDADPSNVSPVVHGAEMRAAETRAVNRALRKAYGIGLCSVEELGWAPLSTTKKTQRDDLPAPTTNSAPGNGQPRLRDRLCQLIRQHQLDPLLIKRFASDFCGTESLREASRDRVEAFINHLAEWAARDRPGLVCHLTSYTRPSVEVKP